MNAKKFLALILAFGTLMTCVSASSTDAVPTKTSANNSMQDQTTGENAITAAEFVGASLVREEENEHPFAAATSNVTVNGEVVNVNAFVRNPGQYPNYPLFMYVDIINRAIAYKQAHPAEDVTVDFAMYSLYLNTEFYFDLEDVNYGHVSGTKIAGRTENICETLVRAAQNGIVVSAVLQSHSRQADIKAFMDACILQDSSFEPGKKVGDYLSVEYITWGSNSAQQMHSKFVAVNHYQMDDNTEMHDAVYLSTSNIDKVEETGEFTTDKDRMQSGILISGSTGVYDSYCHYFDLISDYPDDQAAFRAAVRAAHDAGTLNYSDEYFSTYFMPVPLTPEDAWCSGYNPTVEYIEELADSSGNRLLYCNVYHYNTKPSLGFGIRVLETIEDIASDGKGTLFTKWMVETNSAAATGYGSDQGFLDALEALGPACYYEADQYLKTHCKNFLFAYKYENEMKFVSITGSTNLKWDGAYMKANASIAIKEYGNYHPIFDCFAEQVDEYL